MVNETNLKRRVNGFVYDGYMAEEPWLRGPIVGVDPLAAPVLYAFELAREELA